MLGFNSGTMRLTQLSGFDKLTRSLDSYVNNFAKSKRAAPEHLTVPLSDYEKMQEKAIRYHKSEHDLDVEHVEIFHRDFKVVPAGGLESYVERTKN